MSAAQTRPVDVLVTVGTDHHRFDRLVAWSDAWAAKNPEMRVLIQRGESRSAEFCESQKMFGYDEILAHMAAARAVVTQGGPAGMTDARSMGLCPIVVPRRSDLGEHVDDHQVRFCSWMADRDLIHLADDEQAFHALLDLAAEDRDVFRIEAGNDSVAQSVEAFESLVEPLIGKPRRWFSRRVGPVQNES